MYKISILVMSILPAGNAFTYFKVKSSLNEVGRIGRASIDFVTPLVFYQGPIGEEGVDELVRGLDGTPNQEYQMLVVSSNGGNGIEAERLAHLLNQKNMVFYLGENALCASACVSAFLRTTRRFVAPNVRFNFHQGEAMHVRLRHIPHLLLHGDWPKEPFYMDDWVKEISPRLQDYFGQCSAGNPLRSTHGLTMTWRDIQSVVEGAPRRSCDEALADQPRRGL